MKASVDKLRWVLAGGSLFLLLILVAVVGYGRFRAARMWKQRLDKLGVHIEQTTDNVTYSQTIQGRTVFTLRAGKAIQRKNGTTTLRNVQLTLYGKKDGSEDRISGSEFEYDEKAEIARAIGPVEMDLRVPSALVKNADLAGVQRPAGQGSERDIHVRTSGLTYVRKLGVAATDQQVLLSYAGLECTAKGAEFNSSESIIHLLADVDLHGVLRGKQIQLHAAKADLNHATNTVALTSPHVQSADETAMASTAVVQLRHDGSIESTEAEGAVTLQKLTRRISAARLNSRFTDANVPDQASLSGGVTMLDANAAKPLRGFADRLDGVFDANGRPVRWKASGGAQFDTSARDVHGRLLSRSLKGDQLEASLKPGKSKNRSELTTVHVSGRAQAFAEAATPEGLQTTQLNADELNATFLPGANADTPTLQQILGVGHTRLQQQGPGSAEQASTGDRLQVMFTPDLSRAGQLQVASATQDGHVTVQSRPGTKANGSKQREPVSARADRSVFNGATEDLILSGAAKVTQGNMSIAASELSVNQQTGDSDATGNVLATVSPAEGNSGDATHIQSERAHLDRESQVSSFRSTDASPARLWQGASQVEAASITIDGKKHILMARPEAQGSAVHAVFATMPSKTTHDNNARSPQVERVSARSMDYSDITRVANFAGNVYAQGSIGTVRAQYAQMYFTSAQSAKGAANGDAGSALVNAPSMAGTLDRAVISGGVQLSQPGRTGQGERLVYTSANSTFLLTGSPGHPPQVVDRERGSVTGGALQFRSGDNRVVVSSAGPVADTNIRVHTETGAKQ